MKRLYYILLALSCLFLSSCQQSLEGINIENNQTYSKGPSSIKSIDLNGKLGILYPDRVSLNYILEYNNDVTMLDIRSIMGNKVGLLTLDNKGAKLLASGKIYKDKSAQRLIANLFKINIPADNIVDILLQKIPHSVNVKNPNNLIEQSAFDGYLVEYKNYKTFNGFAIPTDIYISSKDFKLRVNITNVNKVE